MEEILHQVNELIGKNKIKKALSLIKKVNAKQPSYGSLDLEGVCYFHNNQFALAIPRFENALKLAETKQEKSRILNNIASTHIKNDHKDKALNCFISALALDPSANNAQTRLKLCQLACELEKFDIILEYGEKLRSLTDYSIEALHLLILAAICTNNNDKKHSFIAQLFVECGNWSSANNQKFLNLFYLSNEYSLGNQLLERLEAKHNHEKWFNEFKQAFNPNTEIATSLDETQISNELVSGKNKKLINLIMELFENNKSNGATFHPRLRVHEEDNNLSIKVFSSNKTNERLLDIPLNCMPLLNDFDISLSKDDQLVVQAKQTMMSPQAKKTMELMVAIYNETDKITAWKASSPFFSLQAQPDLLTKLIAGKKFNQKVLKFNEFCKNRMFEKLAIESFFGSRTFSYQQEQLLKVGIQTERSVELGLLSIIDFLNHKTKSNYYNVNKSTLSVSGQPDNTTGELYVHYNNFDPLLTYLIYGFIDTQAPWFFSVPIKITTKNNVSFTILGNSGSQSTDNISENGDYLTDFAPDLVALKSNEYQVDKMVIPVTSNSALLNETLKMILLSTDQAEKYQHDTGLINEIAHLEQQIIMKNYHYWQEVSQLNSPVNQDVALLVNTALNHLKSYANKNSILLF